MNEDIEPALGGRLGGYWSSQGMVGSPGLSPQEAVALGRSVIPTRADKAPYFPWQLYQLKRPEREDIEAWEQEYQPCSWAIITGNISNIVTLDFDGVQGRKTMERLGLKPHRRTPSGGYHVDFEHPGWPVRTVNGKSKLELGQRYPGLDIRADGGYAVFTGSTDKGQYVWLRDPTPDSLSILPKVLREFCGLLDQPTHITSATAKNGYHQISRVEPEILVRDALSRVTAADGRNNSGFWLAGQLRDNGYTQTEAEIAMQDYRSRVPDVNTKGQREEYTEAEMMASLRAAYQRPPREPWTATITEGAKGPEQSSSPTPESKSKENKKGKSSEAEESQATRLIGMARDAEFFHTPDGLLYASFTNQGHTETHAIRSKRFRIYLQTLYFNLTGAAIGSKGLQDALGVFEGKASNGTQMDVYCRIAPHGKDIYIDRGGTNWEALEVTRSGWRVIPNPPVKFIRPRGMLELPCPAFDPHAERHFRECFNVQNDDDLTLLKAWTLAALRPKGPYPVLWIKGSHGSAKSTATAVLRKLIDPNEAELRSLPKEERDLAIAASSSRLIALDNMSHLPDWASDAVCRVATGGAFATRELYTDGEEALFKYQCPVVLNGIDDVVTRGDLADRSVIVELAEIPDQKRIDEEVFWSRFESYRPGILAYFLDALQSALSRVDTVQLKEKPRMADFAKFVTAAEPAFGWSSGYFLQVYNKNRKEANNIALDSSVVAQKVRTFLEMLERGNFENIFQSSIKGDWARNGDGTGVTWTGESGQLLENLNQFVSDTERRSVQWPKVPRSVSVVLRRLQPNLKKAGITVVFGKGERRTIDLQFSPNSTEGDMQESA